MTADTAQPRQASPVTVLLSLAPPDGTLRYVVQLTEGKAEGTIYRYFSWWTALFGRYDVFHVHWPEQLVRAKSPLARLAKRVLSSLLLARLRWSGIALVRTLHNLKPHEAGDGSEARFLARMDAATDLSIRLNAATPMDPAKGVTILHGHYIGRYPGAEVRPSEPGRLLYFGLIRPYKGVERLLEVFGAIERQDLQLCVVGKPTTELRTLVTMACERDARISARLEFVPDDVLASEIYRSEMVVLPYREMHNSGAILVALSLGRAVLVPRSQTNVLLAQEVGPGWVNMYEGELTESILLEALARCRCSQRSALPRLSDRDWDLVGRLHYDAYRRAAQARRAHRSRR